MPRLHRSHEGFPPQAPATGEARTGTATASRTPSSDDARGRRRRGGRSLDTASLTGEDRAVLVGRHAEQARLGALLDAARAGHGSALVLRGAPGIGKTALLEHLRAEAEGFQVLQARGVESDSRRAFA